MSLLAAYLAAGLSLLWAVVHIFMGGREIEQPLRRSDLPDAVRGPSVMVWHYVSAVLVGLAAVFLAGAVLSDPALIWVGTGIALCFAVIGVIVPGRMGISYRVMPQGFLFVPVAVLGVISLL